MSQDAKPRASSVKRRIKSPEQLSRIMGWIREIPTSRVSSEDKQAVLGEMHDLHRDLLGTKYGFEVFQGMKRVSVLMCMGMKRASACRIVVQAPDMPMSAEALAQRFKDDGVKQLTEARAALANGGHEALFVRAGAASMLHHYATPDDFVKFIGMTPQEFEQKTGVKLIGGHDIAGNNPNG